MIYNWQQSDWRNFRYVLNEADDRLLLFAEEAGLINGMFKALPDDIKIETIVNTMVTEAVKTSEIEGDYVNRKDVMSSIRNNLGLNTINVPVKDKYAKGVGELMVKIRNNYSEKLNKEILFEWHRMLMSDNQNIAVGKWRTHSEPMQVVSGAYGKETVHFEAPPSVSG